MLIYNSLNDRQEKKFKCTHCKKGFGSERRLEEHLRFHSEVKPFQCQQCPKSFTRKTLLTQHIAYNHVVRIFIEHSKCHLVLSFEPFNIHLLISISRRRSSNVLRVEKNLAIKLSLKRISLCIR